MRKSFCGILILLLFLLALSPAIAEAKWDLGLSWTPVPGENTSRNEEESFDSITGFHIGWAPWTILYASWDSLALPGYMVAGMTSYYDPSANEGNGGWTGGYFDPGFLNLFDAGLRLMIRPFFLSTMIGINNMYVYQEGVVGGMGANLRLEAGLVFNWWGISLSGTSVFSSMPKLVDTMKGLISKSSTNRDWAVKQITEGLVPSILVHLYF
jgi:hypothetical protein